MSFSRRNLLSSGLAALAGGLVSGRARSAPAAAKNLVVVYVLGGWDITYTFDPKPGMATIDAPTGKREVVAGIPILTDASRPNAKRFFQQHGELVTLVNGIQVQSINHPDCSKRMLTGTASETNPDLGAIAAWEHGRELPAPYLALGPTAYTGALGSVAVRTGTAAQIKTLLNPQIAYPRPSGAPARFVPSEEEAGLIDRFVRARAERERATRGQQGYNAARIDDFVTSLERGERFKRFGAALGADLEFTLDLRVQIAIAAKALGEGLSRAVHLEATFGGWDTHAGNELQGPLQEDLFDALGTLVEELRARPGQKSGSTLLDETVVAVVSEMGRTPKLNEAGGKDHWPVTSALVLGGGLRGGRVLGATGDGLEGLPIDLATGGAGDTPLGYQSFAAGLLEATGIDPNGWLDEAEAFHALSA